MVWRQLLLGSFVLATLAGPATAGVIFHRHQSKESRKESSKPAEARTAEVVRMLRSDQDERRRTAAAAELARADLRQHPEAAEALIDALLQDASAAVRAEAAESLGKVRPLTLQAGQALEGALTSDASTRVRSIARAAIGAYVQAGYRS